jgi:hypothetical protein
VGCLSFTKSFRDHTRQETAAASAVFLTCCPLLQLLAARCHAQEVSTQPGEVAAAEAMVGSRISKSSRKLEERVVLLVGRGGLL